MTLREFSGYIYFLIPTVHRKVHVSDTNIVFSRLIWENYSCSQCRQLSFLVFFIYLNFHRQIMELPCCLCISDELFEKYSTPKHGYLIFS